jgi:hypothetical protein
MLHVGSKMNTRISVRNSFASQRCLIIQDNNHRASWMIYNADLKWSPSRIFSRRKRDNDGERARRLSQFWRDDISRNARLFLQTLFSFPGNNSSESQHLAFLLSTLNLWPFRGEEETEKCMTLQRRQTKSFLNRRYER